MPKKVLIFEEDDLLFNSWMIETQIALEQYDDDDYLHALTIEAGMSLLQSNLADIKVIVIGIVSKEDDWRYGKKELIGDIKELAPQIPIVIATNLGDHQGAGEFIYTTIGATYVSTREDVSTILQQRLR